MICRSYKKKVLLLHGGLMLNADRIHVNTHSFVGKPATKTLHSPDLFLLASIIHLTTSCWLLPFQVIYYWLIFAERMWQTNLSGPPGALYSVLNLHLEALFGHRGPQCSELTSFAMLAMVETSRIWKVLYKFLAGSVMIVLFWSWKSRKTSSWYYPQPKDQMTGVLWYIKSLRR